MYNNYPVYERSPDLKQVQHLDRSIWVGPHPYMIETKELPLFQVRMDLTHPRNKNCWGKEPVKQFPRTCTTRNHKLYDAYESNRESTHLDVPYLRSIATELAQLAHENIPTYLHCHQGINRAGVVAIAYLMLSRGLTASQAYNLAVSKRSLILNEEIRNTYFVGLLEDLGTEIGIR